VSITEIDKAIEKINLYEAEYTYYSEEADKKSKALTKVESKIIGYNLQIAVLSGLGPFGKGLASLFAAALEVLYTQLAELNNQYWEAIKGMEIFAGAINSEVSNLESTLENSRALVVSYNQKTNKAGIVHKNSNSYRGTQAIYEIKVNGKTYKFGKADATKKSEIDGKKLPKRTADQMKGLYAEYGKKNVSVTVIFEKKNITTKEIKRIETGKILQHLKKHGTIPYGNRGHMKYGPLDKKPIPKK